ncbi:MAG: VOC family protein [Ignavibacteria bacterium]|nr:VOC family protein [Ignavibacteria bacterium]
MPRVIHFEVHAENPERAAEFYRNVFDWKINKWEGPVKYWLIETGREAIPGINGGIIERRGEIDGQAVIAYVCTIDVPDIDEYAKRVEANKGLIVVPKNAIPGVGWLVYCKDTEGNIFGILQDDRNAK